jgi:PST family polysaccharide transporter
MAWYVYSNADFFVAGWLLGKQQLGAYTLAWTLGSVPVEKISVLIFNVTPAYFSALQRNMPELRRHVLQLTEGIALLTVPLTIGLALVAEEFVMLALGSKWASMIVPLRLLAAYAAVRSITPLIPQVLTVTGDVRYSMWNSVVAAIVLPVGFAIGSRWGIVGIASTWLLVHPLVLLLLYRRAFLRMELPFREYAGALWPAFHSAILMALAVTAARFLLPASVPLPLRFGALVLLGMATYGGTLFLSHRSRMSAIVRALRAARSAA